MTVFDGLRQLRFIWTCHRKMLFASFTVSGRLHGTMLQLCLYRAKWVFLRMCFSSFWFILFLD